jgi:hypothetical protein
VNLLGFSVGQPTEPIEYVFNNRTIATRSWIDFNGTLQENAAADGVLTMDPAPFTSLVDRSAFFINAQCSSPSPTAGLAAGNVGLIPDYYFRQTTCRQIYRVPYLESDPRNLPFWSAGTRAVWSGHQVGQDIHYIGFTENKTTKDSRGKLRRATYSPRDVNGYVDYKMSGAPVSIDRFVEGDLSDGFYMGFVTLGRSTAASVSEAADLGPIVWPRQGYRRNYPEGSSTWRQTSIGFRHPRGLVHDGNLYVSFIGDDGIYFSKAKLSDLNAGLGVNSFHCGPTFQSPCLPQGFSLKSVMDFENSLSLTNPTLMPNPSLALPQGSAVNFSVAWAKDVQLYIAVSERFENGQGETYLYASADMVEWVTLGSVPALQFSGDFYQNGKLNYPSLMNAQDGNSEEIQSSDFYIVGSNSSGCPSWPCKVGRLRISLVTTPTMPSSAYSWEIGDFGSCSATPTYSYGAWSACNSSGQQTRTASCINTNGTQTRRVVCKSSSGQIVDDSNCGGPQPPLTQSCTNSCSGSPVTSQSCNFSGSPSSPSSVAINWDAISNVRHYSMDVGTTKGAWVAPCISQDTLGASTSFTYRGTCSAASNLAVPINTVNRLQVCYPLLRRPGSAYVDDWRDYRCGAANYNQVDSSVRVSLPSYPVTNLTIQWPSVPGVIHYSMDFKISDGTWVPHCLTQDELGASSSFVYKGTCSIAQPADSGDTSGRPISKQIIRKVRVCHPINDNWSNFRCGVATYDGSTSAATSVTISSFSDGLVF